MDNNFYASVKVHSKEYLELARQEVTAMSLRQIQDVLEAHDGWVALRLTVVEPEEQEWHLYPRYGHYHDIPEIRARIDVSIPRRVPIYYSMSDYAVAWDRPDLEGEVYRRDSFGNEYRYLRQQTITKRLLSAGRAILYNFTAASTREDIEKFCGRI